MPVMPIDFIDYCRVEEGRRGKLTCLERKGESRSGRVVTDGQLLSTINTI